MDIFPYFRSHAVNAKSNMWARPIRPCDRGITAIEERLSYNQRPWVNILPWTADIRFGGCRLALDLSRLLVDFYFLVQHDVFVLSLSRNGPHWPWFFLEFLAKYWSKRPNKYLSWRAFFPVISVCLKKADFWLNKPISESICAFLIMFTGLSSGPHCLTWGLSNFCNELRQARFSVHNFSWKGFVFLSPSFSCVSPLHCFRKNDDHWKIWSLFRDEHLNRLLKARYATSGGRSHWKCLANCD